MISIEALGRQNPWWLQVSAITEDPHVSEYESAPLKWEPPCLRAVRLDQDLIYVVLGPRQVGKTTFFKLLIRDLLLQKQIPPRTILYLNCEALGPQTPQELAELLRGYVLWARASSHAGNIGVAADRLYLFLDEATCLKDWERGVKIVADEGKLRGTTVIVTGSHTAGMRRGGERLPGRRGRDDHLDLVLLPLHFRAFVQAWNPSLRGGLPSFPGWGLEALFDAAQEVALWADQITPHFYTYLRTGGFPRAIRDEAMFGHVKQNVYKLCCDAFIGDLGRLGRRESILRELTQWIINRRENPFDWSQAARETQSGTHPTVREYIEDAEAAFLWDVLHRVKNLGESLRAPRSPKRICFNDCFSFHSLRSWVFGYDHAWRAAEEFLADPSHAGYLVEGVVASHLRRMFGEKVFYWRNGHEIDFVVFQQEQRSALIEVKYQTRVLPDNAKALTQQGGGILLTRQQFSYHPDRRLLLLPVHYLLLLLRDADDLCNA